MLSALARVRSCAFSGKQFSSRFCKWPVSTRSLSSASYSTSENTEVLRARLLYQSRKRGIRENDLLLSTYAKVHLHSMTRKQLMDYDKILNMVDNEWDLYKYIVGAEPVPEEIDSETMKHLVKFASNQNREQRLFMPDLD